MGKNVREIKSDCTIEEVIQEIKNMIKESERKEIMWFSVEGESCVFEGGEITKKKGLIEISYEVWGDLIAVTTNDDLWMPIGNSSDFWSSSTVNRESLINIDRATVNSKRLENCFVQIRERGDFKKIYPAKDEIMRDYMTIQKGFRMYYYKKYFNELDIKEQIMFKLKDFIII